MHKTAKQEVEQLKRSLLNERLGQCTEKQRELFGRLYPDGVREDQLEDAINLCNRTLRRNQTP